MRPTKGLNFFILCSKQGIDSQPFLSYDRHSDREITTRHYVSASEHIRTLNGETIPVYNKSSVGGQAVSVPAFYNGQITSGTPDHYVSVEEASRLKQSKKAMSINRGLAILIFGPKKFKKFSKESKKSGWKVVGQTTKHPDGPGFPRWASV